MDIMFMNILYFLWREASPKMKAGKYENLGQFFMLIFKNWTAPDDTTKTADMLWYLARIIKSYFQYGWTSAYHEKYMYLVYAVEVSVKREIFTFSCFTETSTT